VSAAGDYRRVSRLGLVTTLAMAGLMVLGSIVRSTGSGLACPDWPLCGGRLLPPLEPHVLVEWLHRFVALLVSVLLLGTVGALLAHRATRARLGGLAALALLLLGGQIFLGALTVWRGLSPLVVGAHLAVGLLLFATLLTLTSTARAGASVAPAWGAPTAGAGAGALALMTAAAYAQCVLGGVVSATHAGAVCRDWPLCDGVLFPPLRGLAGIQMLHRYGAYTLVVLGLVTALRARRSPDPRARRASAAALGLVLLQALLGIWNLTVGTPPWLTALHLATAIALVAVTLSATLVLAPLPAPATARVATAAA